MLNYRRYPVDRIPEAYHQWLQPRVDGGGIEVMDTELDALLGDLSGWYADRHPNLAGDNVIAVETSEYLIPVLRSNARDKQTND